VRTMVDLISARKAVHYKVGRDEYPRRRAS
jgi:hypothetical protein